MKMEAAKMGVDEPSVKKEAVKMEVDEQPSS